MIFPIVSKIVSRTKILAQGRLSCFPRVVEMIQGRSGIEIGGPSNIFHDWFRPMPIYSYVGSLDNCDFSQSTSWAKHKRSYVFSKRKPPGEIFLCEGSDLQSITDSRYDFLLSSHSLEHFANPIKALREWQRVVKPGGTFIIVLPHFAKTFDYRRRPTSVEHMVDDFCKGTKEDDLTHVEEVFQAHRLEPGQTSDEKLHALLMDNFNHRMMHHHVFDENNSRQLLEASGLKVLEVETAFPFHIFLTARNQI